MQKEVEIRYERALKINKAEVYKKWAEKNREHLKKRRRAYYEANKQLELTRTRKWLKDHPERAKEIARLVADKRRFGRPREEVLSRDGYKCCNCKSTKRLNIHHKDHVGRNSNQPNNDINNLETLCHACHISHHHTGLPKPKSAFNKLKGMYGKRN